MAAIHAERIPASAAPYAGVKLRLYDKFVLGFTSPYAWGIRRDDIADLYARHCTDDHAEVGVGTGAFLRHARSDWSSLALIDANPKAIDYVRARITSSPVMPDTYSTNICRPTKFPARQYRSVAANFVLHCLPRASKTEAIRNLAALTADDGCLFGATVIGSGVAHNALGRTVMAVCNRTGTFDNADDSEAVVSAMLSTHFQSVQLRRMNRVVLFTARNPLRKPSEA